MDIRDIVPGTLLFDTEDVILAITVDEHIVLMPKEYERVHAGPETVYEVLFGKFFALDIDGFERWSRLREMKVANPVK